MQTFSSFIHEISNLIHQLPASTFTVLAKLCIVAIIMIITRQVLKSVTPLIQDMCKRYDLEQHSCHLLTKVTRALITIIGITIALQNVGIEVTMILTVFGITGIVISYGMKDIVANVIASILILGYKHIKINDYIKIKDWEGTVVDINLRYTTLQHEDKKIFVPNIVLYTQPVAIIKK